MKLPRLLPTLLLLASLAAPALRAADASPASDPANTWDLTLLYADDAAWRVAKDKVAAGIPKVKEFQGKLGESPASLRAALDYLQGLRQQFTRLSVYASLKRDENTRVSSSLEHSQEIGLLGTQLSRATSFVRPEVLATGETKIRAFLDAEPGLAIYRFDLLEMLRAAPHTLGAEAEGVMSAASLVTGTPSSLYNILANADLPWPTVKLSDGTEARLDQAGYTKWRAAPNRADREIVFDAFWKKIPRV